ncbi:MAG: DUF933 domain-containing protein [Myxococcota bacterium]|nr:DUF933 domain-containing protein [Myxococcota bacterium]
MKIGIVGFAGSGKTTLFNALTGQTAGFGGQKVNLGAIKVPDDRVDRLSEIDTPQKTTYAEITFADVPGGRGDSSLDPQTLGRIREMDALAMVARGFAYGGGDPNPIAELSAFESELLLADMQVIEKRIERLAKDHSDPRQLKLLHRCLDAVTDEKPLSRIALSKEEKSALSGFAFLSLKPVLVVLNVSEDQAGAPVPEQLGSAARHQGWEVMALSGPIEAEIATLSPSDQGEFLADLGVTAPASNRFIRSAFSLLDLISFFTRGSDECRAWPIRKGSTALDAAGAVHSDIARGFIRAEVTRFEDFSRLKSESACRDAGVRRIEGRDYIVQDGDICHFRFNV